MNRRLIFVGLFVLVCTLVGTVMVDAQGPRPGSRSPRANLGTAFTYQGLVKKNGTSVNGSCNFQFTLFADAGAVTPIGSMYPVNNVWVGNGLFTATIDFGANAFTGDARWLRTAVECPPSSGFSTLPLQPIMPAPMALALPGLYTQQNATSPNVIGGYSGNVISPTVVGGTIGGGGTSGNENKVWASYATVGGGTSNTAMYDNAFVGGGTQNRAGNAVSTIGGGYHNFAMGYASAIGGGLYNSAGGGFSSVGGGTDNTASGQRTTVCGGSSNIASADGAFVGGGGGIGYYPGNQARALASAIAGGSGNAVWGIFGFVGGGLNNTVNSQYAINVGGENNQVGGNYGFIGGGISNTVNSEYATIVGGENNQVGGNYGFLGGGRNNVASNLDAVVAGGAANTASGAASTVPGGYLNHAQGNDSFAGGTQAKALHNGTFVWGDNNYADVASTADNQFIIRAAGGITMYTNSGLNSGASLYPGSGSWNVLSNKNIKANFVQVNSQDILARVNELPITTWNYTTQDTTIRHIGPMAQDFYAAFSVGENDTSISTVDADGVALAALQGLSQVVKDKDAKISNLESQLSNLEARLTLLEQSTQMNNAPTHSDSTTNLALIVIGGLLGIIVAQKTWQRGER